LYLWRAFLLHPDTLEDGISLEQLFANFPIDVQQMLNRLKTKARELGLPFGDRTTTYNSRSAQELGLWVEAKGRGEQFHKAAFAAYFVEGKNIT